MDIEEYLLPLARLAEQFRKLPGIGRKTAMRLALGVLSMSESEAADFAGAILSAKEDIHECRVCHNLTTGELCPVCSDSERDRSVICVLEDARAVMAFQNVGNYHGLFHVLGGVLSPASGIGADKLHIDDLAERCKNGVKEVIIATNPTVEGEATAMYIAKRLEGSGVKVTRLAYGMPVGADIEFTDEVTLLRAIEGRRDI